MKKKLYFFRIFLFIILGLLISMQIRSIQTEADMNNKQKNLVELQKILKKEKEKSLALEVQLKEQENKVDEFETRLSKDEGIEFLKADLDSARFLAGLTDVAGPGVVISLDDSKKRTFEGVDPNDTVIHDWQLVDIVNLLKSCGAQAISINDERLVSTSEIQCAGPTVSVNHVRYTVPFIIKAIGNADYLEAKLKEPGNVFEIMSIYGIQINIKKESNITISKYRDLFSKRTNVIKVGE